MKLVIAVVSNEDASPVSEGLSKGGFSSTRMASTGGFLRGGNTTLFAVCDDEDVSTVVDIVKDNAGGLDKSIRVMEQPFMPVANSGAAIFVLNVEQFLKV